MRPGRPLRSFAVGVVNAIAGAANFVVRVIVGVAFSTVARLIIGTMRPGIRLTTSARLMAMVKPGVSLLRAFAMGTASVLVKPGLAIANRSSGTLGKPITVPAFDVVHSFVNLTANRAANAVVEEAVGTRTDWADDANATGPVNGSVATITGNSLGSRGGRLVLSYPANVGKDALTITKVELKFHISQAGTSLGNGSLRIGYEINGGARIELAAFTANLDALITPQTFDITAAVGGVWSLIPTIKTYIEFNTAALNTSSASVDAVLIHIQANRTELNT